MSGRTQFWAGSVMLALAVGLFVGGVVFPRPSYSQDVVGEGRSRKYAVVAGIRGILQNTQSLYIIDDRNDVLWVFEYNPRGSGKEKATPRAHIDLRDWATELQESRARRQKKAEGLP
jgi:hypothetical protein